jgi:hypothetical protein
LLVKVLYLAVQMLQVGLNEGVGEARQGEAGVDDVANGKLAYLLEGWAQKPAV